MKNVQGSAKAVSSMIDVGADADILAVFRVLWEGRIVVILTSALFAIGSAVVTNALPNIYRSEALLSPVGSATEMNSLMQKYSGLASLAGISVPVPDEVSKASLAIEVLRSRKFITGFIEKHNILVPLMAAKRWDEAEAEVVLNSDVYDVANKKWVRDVPPAKAVKPSSLEAYEVFKRGLYIGQNKESGLVEIAIENVSPLFAKEWVTWIVKDINDHMRERDIKEAKNSIQFLQEKIDETPSSELRSAFFELIQNQTQKIMLAEVRAEYVFSTIDPAVVPETKVRPKRKIITFFGLLVGMIAGVVIVILRNYLGSWKFESKGI